MAHAQDEKYHSPYAADAVAHGKDIPLWAKIKEGKFKKGKFSLAKLRVRAPECCCALCSRPWQI